MSTQETNDFDTQDSGTSVLDGAGLAELRDMPPRTIADFMAEGVNPDGPTDARPGTEDKVRMLAARYEAGLPLWNTEDCLDHSPKSGSGINLLALAPVAEADDLDEEAEDEVDE